LYPERLTNEILWAKGDFRQGVYSLTMSVRFTTILF
jgi:hypothetical protein